MKMVTSRYPKLPVNCVLHILLKCQAFIQYLYLRSVLFFMNNYGFLTRALSDTLLSPRETVLFIGAPVIEDFDLMPKERFGIRKIQGQKLVFGIK